MDHFPPIRDYREKILEPSLEVKIFILLAFIFLLALIFFHESSGDLASINLEI